MRDLKTTLELKRTYSTKTSGPMGWRELAAKIGLKSGQLARYQAFRDLKQDKGHRCPTCLQKLASEKL